MGVSLGSSRASGGIQGSQSFALDQLLRGPGLGRLQDAAANSPQLQQNLNSLFGFGTQAAQGFNTAAQGGLTGQQMLQQFGSGGATQAGITALGNQIQQQLTEQILPGITGGAIGANALGSSRQGLLEVGAVQGAQRAFGQGAADLLLGGLGQQLQAAQSLTSSQLAGLGGGIGALAPLLQTATGAAQAPLTPLLPFRALIGNLGGTSTSRGTQLGF